MPYRQGTFKEKFTAHELSKLEFRKLNGYYFAKKNRQDPTYSWMLIKDNTSAVIKYLCYVQATKEQLLEFLNSKTQMNFREFERVFKPQLYHKCELIRTMEDLESAVNELYAMDPNIIANGLLESPIVKYGSELKKIDLSQI